MSAGEPPRWGRNHGEREGGLRSGGSCFGGPGKANWPREPPCGWSAAGDPGCESSGSAAGFRRRSCRRHLCRYPGDTPSPGQPARSCSPRSKGPVGPIAPDTGRCLRAGRPACSCPSGQTPATTRLRRGSRQTLPQGPRPVRRPRSRSPQTFVSWPSQRMLPSRLQQLLLLVCVFYAGRAHRFNAGTEPRTSRCSSGSSWQSPDHAIALPAP